MISSCGLGKEDNQVIKILLSQPYFDSDELKEIRKVLDSRWVSYGPKVKEFEDAVAEYLGVRYAICVANCTSALHLALRSIDVGYGDEVLVADYTFPATGHAVLYCRAKPVFVDVESKTYNMSPDMIVGRITRRTKAIMPVHTFGQPAEMDAIVKIANAHGLKVIEDAACALGAKYKDRYAGTIGDIGCFSLHGRKGITTGEGGMAVTNNKLLADRMRRLSIFGVKAVEVGHRRSRFLIPEFIEVGYNYKMSAIAAAIGIAQLRKLDKIIGRKRLLAEYWNKKLENLKFIKPPYVNDAVEHIYQSYVALLDRRIDRAKMIERLSKKGIETQIGTYASHLQPVYKAKERCPNSRCIFDRALALPLYYELKEKEIDIAVRYIEKTLEELA